MKYVMKMTQYKTIYSNINGGDRDEILLNDWGELSLDDGIWRLCNVLSGWNEEFERQVNQSFDGIGYLWREDESIEMEDEDIMNQSFEIIKVEDNIWNGMLDLGLDPLKYFTHIQVSNPDLGLMWGDYLQIRKYNNSREDMFKEIVRRLENNTKDISQAGQMSKTKTKIKPKPQASKWEGFKFILLILMFISGGVGVYLKIQFDGDNHLEKIGSFLLFPFMLFLFHNAGPESVQTVLYRTQNK